MGPKRGDLEPPLVLDIGDARTTADLTGVTSWRLVAYKRGDLTGTPVIDYDVSASVVVDSTNKYKAVVTHSWSGTQTAESGLLDFKTVATWPNGHKQSFPNGGFIAVMIDD
jgi:hypothetical protein